MTTFFRVLGLAWHALHAWPEASPADVMRASVAAVAQESDELPSEVLFSIAQHESDLKPNAVSFIKDGHRVDLLWTTQALPSRVVFGYLSAMGSPDVARAAIVADGGMRAGADELREWLGTCRGDLRCALRGHAGGTACALDEASCTASARAFARLFYARAMALGMPRTRAPLSRRARAGSPVPES